MLIEGRMVVACSKEDRVEVMSKWLNSDVAPATALSVAVPLKRCH